MYVGIGYDVHRFAKGRRLVLGGVLIPHSRGLAGHSDADVIVHAVMDALLGAAGLPDIGHWFPDTDGRFAGAASIELLKAVGRELKRRKYAVVNIDISLIAEEPKVAPFAGRMRTNLADALNVPLTRIGLKATTNEGMGFVGRKEGIACFAAASVGRAARK